MEENQTYNGYSLPSGTILHQTYRIQKVLGEGGFGIIYVCDNLVTGKTVAIKEYFPSGLAKRERPSTWLWQQDVKLVLKPVDVCRESVRYQTERSTCRRF